MDVLVGIPSGDTRDQDLSEIAMMLKPGGKRQKRAVASLIDTVENKVTNAELLYIHTHGSRLQNIPPRPVIEPAIWAPGNKENIAAELKDAVVEVLHQNPQGATIHLKLAGTVASNAAKRWFTDPRNDWLPNSQKTIDRKGSDRPLIDTGELRRAITYVVEENKP
jgi:hypothetical protein